MTNYIDLLAAYDILVVENKRLQARIDAVMDYAAYAHGEWSNSSWPLPFLDWLVLRQPDPTATIENDKREGELYTTIERLFSIDELLSIMLYSCDHMGSQKALAAQLGVSESYLSDVLSKRRMPGKRILSALGFESVQAYKK